MRIDCEDGDDEDENDEEEIQKLHKLIDIYGTRCWRKSHVNT